MSAPGIAPGGIAPGATDGPAATADLAQLYPIRRRRRLGFGRLLKRFLPRTLFARSFLIITVPVVLAQAIATFVFYDRHWDAITNRLSFAVAGEIAFVIDELSAAGSDEGRQNVLKRAAAMELYVTALPGERLAPATAPKGNLETVLARALAEKVGRPFAIDTHIAHEWYEIRVQMPDGVLSVVSPERRLYSFTSYLFIAWMLGSSLVLFAIAILFMRNQIRPIRRLALAADAFGKGRDVPNFKPEGAAEVRQAAAAFLTMRERIQRQISQRTQMLAGVSHDLRTPLTRMRLQLAMLEPGPDVEDLKADVADMETMIEGYLAFARGEGAEPTQRVELAPLLTEVAANARREGGVVDLTLDGAPVVLALRPNAFKRCIANLVGNARRHGGRVWLSLRHSADGVDILVDDDGPGIPADMREEVFRPFSRLDPARDAAGGGIGLGLTIARDVARRHGGDVLLEESPRGGLRAVVRLPH